jgi:aspartate aminotransferase
MESRFPNDNPTGQFLNQQQLIDLAKICVKHNIWMVSDEAYRQLYYGEDGSSSVWKISEENVPGIAGTRISIESASKVWNACGLRIGGLVTDNLDFHTKSVSEYTANLCANAIGQEIWCISSRILLWSQKMVSKPTGLLS